MCMTDCSMIKNNYVSKPQSSPAEYGKAQGATTIKKGNLVIFQSTLFTCLLFFLFYFFVGSAFSLNPKSELGGDIIIVMEDDILMVDSGDPEDLIDNIVIYENGEVVLEETDYGKQVYTTSLGNLKSGTYTVEVFTKYGNHESRSIVLN